MSEFLKMDIFFVVTTVVVVMVGVLATIALYYVIRILRNVEHVSERVSEESDLIRQDLQAFRTNVRAEGFRWKHLSEFFASIVKRATPKGRAKRNER